MSDKRISQLPYVGNTGYTPNDLLAIVNYDVPSGTTKHTPLSQFLPYALSGITSGGDIVSGTYFPSSGLLQLDNSTGGTITIPGYQYVVGGSYNDITEELTLTNNDGSNFLITGFTDTYFTGMTFQTPAMDLTITRNDGFSDTVSLLPLLGDTFVTGGTYDLNTGDVEFTNSTGGTFTVTGFVTGYTDHYVTGGTYDITTGTLDLDTQTTSVSIGGISILHEIGTGLESTQRINVNSELPLYNSCWSS